METGSRDHHMRQLEDIIRPWWACPAEPSGSLDDELPVGECRWGEEDVNCALCEEVERGGGVRSEPSAVVWTEFTRSVKQYTNEDTCSETYSSFSIFCASKSVYSGPTPL